MTRPVLSVCFPCYLRADDANEMAGGLVRSLRRSGQQIGAATFEVVGGLTLNILAEETVSPASSEHIMQFFVYAHLPPPLQKVSAPFAELAHVIVETTPRNPERTVALRKLLEAKDAAVRALLAKDPS